MPLACGRIGYDGVGVSAQGTGSTGGGSALDAQGAGGSTPDGASSNGGAGGAAGAGAGGVNVGGAAGSGGGSVVDGAAGSGGGAGSDGAAGLGGSAGAGGLTGSGGSTGVDGAAGSDADAGLGSDGALGTIIDAGTVPCALQTYAGHTYAFCDGLVDWPTARAECALHGMRLVRIDDAAENAWVISQAVFSAQNFRRHYLWLGGYEPVTDGDWHWTDGEAFWLGAANGTPVNGLYTNWGRTEPNNATASEACASIPLNDTTWIDEQCGTAEYFACELY